MCVEEVMGCGCADKDAGGAAGYEYQYETGD
jgi:hypothetical protein